MYEATLSLFVPLARSLWILQCSQIPSSYPARSAPETQKKKKKKVRYVHSKPSATMQVCSMMLIIRIEISSGNTWIMISHKYMC